MSYTILTQIETPQVKKAAKQLRLNSDDIINIYFDSGIEYLDILRQRICRKRIFDAMFRPLLSIPGVSKMGPNAAITIISHSPIFWSWWSAQFWCICRQGAFQDQIELFFRLQFNEALIPHFVLKQIFYAKQNPHSRQGVELQSSIKTDGSNHSKGQTGKRIEHPV